MQQNFTWSEATEKAAGLVARGDSDTEVAEAVGVTRQTVFRWKKNPEFSARVASVISVARETVQAHVIADKDARVGAASERWVRLQKIVLIQLNKYLSREESGMSGAPAVPTAATEEEDTETQQNEAPPSVDATVLREARELEEHAARLLGQWSEKHEHSGPGKGPIPVIVIPSIIPLNEAEVQEMALPAPKKRS